MLKAILKNLSIYSLIPITTGILSFFITPINTRFLTESDYGILGLLDSTIILLSVFITLQFHSGITRLYFDLNTKDEQQDYLGSCFSIFMLLALVVPLFYGTVLYFLFPYLVKNHAFSFYPFVPMQILFYILSQFAIIPSLIFYVNQKPFKQTLISISTFVITNAISLICIIKFKLGAVGMLIGPISCGIIMLPVFLHITFKHIKLSLNLKYIKSTLMYSLPFIPTTIGVIIYTNFDKFILDKYLAIDQIGIYSFAKNLILPLTMILSTLDAAFLPIFYQKKKENMPKQDLEKLINILTIVFALITIGWVYFINEFAFLFNEWVLKSFPLLAFLAIFGYTRLISIFPSGIILYEKKTKYIPYINLIPAAINIVLNIIFINYWGIYGAVFSTVITGTLILGLTHYYAFRIDKNNFDYKKIVLLFLFVILFCSFNNVIFEQSFWIRLLLKALALICFVIISLSVFNISFKSIRSQF